MALMSATCRLPGLVLASRATSVVTILPDRNSWRHLSSSSTSSSITDLSMRVVTAVSQSQPVISIQESLMNVHDVTGLPWWSVVVGSACVVRTLITFPLAAYQVRVLGRYAALSPEIEKLARELSAEMTVAVKRFAWKKDEADRVFKRSMRKIIRGLVVRDNCHPFKASILLFVQIPVWLCLSFAFRNLVHMMPVQDFTAHLVFLAMSEQGALWFSNLTMPDVYFILPIVLGLTNLAVTEIHASRMLNATKFKKSITYLLYGVSVFMIPMASFVPSCMALYWTTSSVLGLLQNLVLLSPAFRRLVGIPRTPDAHSDHPYRDLVEHLKAKLRF